MDEVSRDGSVDHHCSISDRVMTDVVLVGSGLAGTFSLIRLTESALEKAEPVPLRVVSVDREGEFHAGIPYGRRSGTSGFLITALSSFMPLPERARFSAWLTANRHWMFEGFKSGGGTLSAEWLERHAAEITAGEWDTLYLPRYLVGLYLRDRVAELLAEASDAGVVSHEYLCGEVTDIEDMGDSYQVSGTFPGRLLQSRTVALGLGMPAARRFESAAMEPTNNMCFIQDPFSPGVKEALARVSQCLSAHGDEQSDVLILGTNASAVEMIYRLVDDDSIRPFLRKIVTASPSGSLPRRLAPPSSQPPFEPLAMLSWSRSGARTAESVHDAMRDDIDLGLGRGIEIADVLPVIFRHLGNLLGQLDRTEKLSFATTWGLRLVNVQRRSGPDLSDMVEELTANGLLEVVTGTFKGLGEQSSAGVLIRHQDPQTGAEHVAGSPFRAVINCTGADSLHQFRENGLIASLADRSIVSVNASGRGIFVDDTLAAHRGVFVLGPMMSGNVIGGSPVWHMEDCGRIMSYAGLLAESVLGVISCAQSLNP